MGVEVYVEKNIKIYPSYLNTQYKGMRTYLKLELVFTMFKFAVRYIPCKKRILISCATKVKSLVRKEFSLHIH